MRIRPHNNPAPLTTPLLLIAYPMSRIPIINPQSPTLPTRSQHIAIIMRKRIRLLAMNSKITHLQHFIAQAQGHAADVFDKAHDQRCPHDVPADDEERADDLQPDLLAVAGDGAAGVRDAEGGAAVGGRPETCLRGVC